MANKKRAFITGIAGQDGSYLSEHLLEKDIEVHGIIRRNSVPEHQESRIAHLEREINTYYGDVSDVAGLTKLFQEIQPDYIFNIAAQSHVRISFDVPIYTVQTNALGVINVLEAYRNHCPKARFYQASSSEMFGNSVDEDGFQRENTPMRPTSPYGCAKVFGYNITRHYRNAYKLFASNGILFNHESPRRGSNFVTNKVVKAAVRIKLGLQKNLELGNMDSYRDWGHSYDYVRAMVKILEHDIPDDFVIATGDTHSVRELVKYVFSHSKIDLNYANYVIQNEKYMRPEELKYLKGDSSRARQILDWRPTYNFETLLDEMINYWFEIYENKN
ncbi:MAG: GDP-mannose 4,6-dehydratase [Ignavibacteriaceae bacterium]|jgi:GDPmannose 4,6-dehydratase|nr:MAG: GDP-mannose 4,6-dehydratase [Ignavibacteriaceae bacterium]